MFQLRGNAGIVTIWSYSPGSLAPMAIAALRLLRLAIHFACGFCAALAFGWLSPGARAAVIRWWARGLLAALGVRLHVSGAPAQEPGLVVANHISWLDVIAIAAARPALFVCKSEIAAWPGIGWLLKRAGTIFIHRGSFRDVWRVNLELRARLAASQSVAAFPEGTTTEGREVLAFRPALFQPAVERGFPIYPVALAYSSDEAAYVGETSFGESLAAVARAPRLEVHLAMLPPINTRGLKRRQAADLARGLILARTFGLRMDTAHEKSAEALQYTVSTATPNR
jgi:1-acyl-sn-glycerol-3-phosphate acyltransferase